MTTYYASKRYGSESYDGTAPYFVSGTTGPKLNARSALALAAASDTVALFSGDDFSNDAPDSLAALQPTVAVTIATYGGAARAKIGCPDRALTVTGAVSGATTDLTIASHGLAAGDWVTVAEVGGLTGASGSAHVTAVPDANTVTVALATSGTYTSGGYVVTYSLLDGVRINGVSNVALLNLEITKAKNGMTTTGTVSGTFGSGLWIHHVQNHGQQHVTGSGTGIVYVDCEFDHCRNDATNLQGTNTTVFYEYEVRDCRYRRIGYNPDDSLSWYTYAHAANGGGDGVTCHGGCRGYVYRSSFAYCVQGSITHVNTVGTNYVFDCSIEESAGSGIVASSGGSLVACGNVIVAPILSTLDTSSTCANLLISGAGSGTIWHNTSITERGQLGGSTTAPGGTKPCYAYAYRGTGAVTHKNNAAISNGTAPFMSIASSGALALTTGGNYYSHTGTLWVTSSGNKTLATWQAFVATGFSTPDTDAVSGGVNVVGGSAASAAAAFVLPDSALRAVGVDPSGASLTQVLTDRRGIERGATPDIGAIAFSALPSAFRRARR